MRNLKLTILFLSAFFAQNVAFSQQVNLTTVVEQNPPALSCSTTVLIASGTLSSISYVFNGNVISAVGNNITVDVNYITPFITIPTIGPFSENVDLGMLAAGTYTVTVNGVLDGIINSTVMYTLVVSNCCGAIPSFSVNDLTVCVGDQIQFTNTSTGQTTQDWYEDNNYLTSTQNMTATAGPAGTYVYKLVVSDGICSDSVEQSVTVFNPPVINSITPSVQVLCQGSPFSIASSATGGTSFNWLMDGASYGSGNTLNSTAIGSPGLHTFELVVQNAGCADTMGTQITYLEAPVAGTISPSGSVLCLGDSVNFLGAVTGVVSEDWYLDGVFATTGNSYLFTPASAGNYVIKYLVENANNCLDSAETTLNVAALPFLDFGPDTNNCLGPVLLDAGAGMLSYQWQDFSTNQTFTASGMGTYSCTITDANGCVSQDAIFVESCSGIEETTAAYVQVYPNPTSGILYITKSFDGASTIEVCDMTGKLLFTTSANELDLSGFEDGVYLIRVDAGEKSAVYRVIKK